MDLKNKKKGEIVFQNFLVLSVCSGQSHLSFKNINLNSPENRLNIDNTCFLLYCIMYSVLHKILKI